MSRIKMIDGDEVKGEVKLLFDAVTGMLGRVPNSYRVLARVPLVSKLLLPFNASMQREGAGSLLTSKIKEMVIIKTSHIMPAIIDLRIIRRLVKRLELLKNRLLKSVQMGIWIRLFLLNEKRWPFFGLNILH